ncbi:MAG: hypothetical protein RBU37_00850 [Myxococcota bacterium]|nr:hypothetical protein [Myxococcota bacterium]
MRRVVVWCKAVLLCFFVAGCGDDAQVKEDASQAGAEAKPDRARFGPLQGEQRSFDLNGDGRADQLHYSVAGALTHVARDLNFDERFDLYEHFSNGQLVEIELDLDMDGAIDVVEEYANGRLEAKRYCIGFRSRMTVSRYYDADGALVRIERDSDEDGTVDTWEHYAPGASSPTRVEVDTNGDGQPDRQL